jgi:ABC-type nitrate/sulfonate/bicarbonate transport system ATPase subunit
MGAVGQPLAPMMALSIDIRRKLYPARGKAPAHLAIEGLKLAVHNREFVCVLGPSGCGKSTLLNIVAGLDTDFEGQICVSRHAEQRLSYMFQTPRLLPWRTVLENVVLAVGEGPEAVETSRGMLAQVGLNGFENAYPGQVSVGMQRRTALARAFAVRPTILLMDEPFVSLDETNAEKLRALLAALWRDHPTTVIFVTHDLREALRLGDRLITLGGAPAKVVRDILAPLPPALRSDPLAIENERARILVDMDDSFFRSDKDYTKDSDM